MFPSSIDPRSFADQGRRVEGNVPPSVLQRLSEAVPEVGEVVADLSFFRDEQGRLRVSGTIRAELRLKCQRCEQLYDLELHPEVEAAIVWSDEQARNLPAELDPWPAEERLDLAAALEDELLLALPTMPVHPEAECSGAAHYSTEEVAEQPKPFAGLEVLKKSPDKNT